jgi:hypothetical protein
VDFEKVALFKFGNIIFEVTSACSLEGPQIETNKQVIHLFTKWTTNSNKNNETNPFSSLVSE